MRPHHCIALLLLYCHLAWQIPAKLLQLRSSDDTSFVPGTIPKDADGNQINAHEGWILQIEDSYLWYGTSHKENTTDPATGSSDWLSGSINLFVSHDLASWQKKKAVFSAALISAVAAKRAGLEAGGPYRIERPKVLYNAARRYYVLIFHVDSIDLRLAQVGWATSPSPYGPFTFQQASQPDGLGSLDITVATYGDNGDAYLVRSVPDGSIQISKLAKDYLGTTGPCSSLTPHPSQTMDQHPTVAAISGAAGAAPTGAGADMTPFVIRARALLSQRKAQGGVADGGGTAVTSKAGKAAPCLFSYGGRWYLLAAEKSGWEPSPLHLYVSDGSELCGAAWTELKHPTTGPGAQTGLQSIPAFVFRYTSGPQVLPIYFGDRWNVQGPGSVGNSSYVWLPFVAPTTPEEPMALQLANPGVEWRIRDYLQPAVLLT